MSDDLYVQYGCGWDAPDQWLNFDGSPTLRVERVPIIGKPLSAALKGNPKPFPDNVRYGDIVKGLPVNDGSCAGVYCSHILEHLRLEDCRKALANTKQLLRPGGIFRLVLPDLRYYAKKYVASEGPEAALQFMRDTHLGERVRIPGLKGVVWPLLANSKHLWMWDHSSMEHELRAAGFTDIRRAEFGDLGDPHFAAVERRDRWENCLGMECAA